VVSCAARNATGTPIAIASTVPSVAMLIVSHIARQSWCT
jgi:hypothetical protein